MQTAHESATRGSAINVDRLIIYVLLSNSLLICKERACSSILTTSRQGAVIIPHTFTSYSVRGVRAADRNFAGSPSTSYSWLIDLYVILVCTERNLDTAVYPLYDIDLPTIWQTSYRYYTPSISTTALLRDHPGHL